MKDYILKKLLPMIPTLFGITLATFLFARKSTVAVHRRFDNARLYPLGFDTREWFVPGGLRKYSN